MTTIMFFNGVAYYMYDPVEKSAIKLSVDSVRPESSGTSSISQYNPVPDGSETVNGVDCAIFKYTAPSGSTRMWISKQNGMTMKVVSGTTITEYSNYNFSAIFDITFELPVGTVIIDLPDITIPNPK